ncbi:MAG: hypothetical protein GY780_08565 [bacterium]|nr:hypothetical protein [bacterium]
MSLGNPRPENSQSHPGEPGVGVDLAPPFVAYDEPTGWLFSLNRFGIRPGLLRIEALLSGLGNPEKKLRTLVTAGTNGKGSTTRILAQLLMDAGYKVVTFTSPHLLNVHERICINDAPIDPADFARRVQAIKPLTEKHEASWFETLTALAVQVAYEEKADFFCCETGLGGRLDATNALPAEAILLTTVGLDHEAILGNTREEIAAEKLGLLKNKTPLFCGVDPDLRFQVFQTAVTQGNPVYFLDELANWPASSDTGTAKPWDLALRENFYPNLPDLGASSMRRNVALALLALTELQKIKDQRLLPADISQSLGNLFLPGRYQSFLRNPDFVFDTAHNEQALNGALAHFKTDKCSGRRIVFFGAMHNKELEKMPADGFAGFDLILAAPVSIPRSRTAAELATLLEAWGIGTGAMSEEWEPGLLGLVAPDLASALLWLAKNLKTDDRVLVTGSCFMVAETMHKLGFHNLEMTRLEGLAEKSLAHFCQKT